SRAAVAPDAVPLPLGGALPIARTLVAVGVHAGRALRDGDTLAGGGIALTGVALVGRAGLGAVVLVADALPVAARRRTAVVVGVSARRAARRGAVRLHAGPGLAC